MNVMHKRWMAAGIGALALTIVSACAVEGVGVDGSVGVGYVGYDGGYYEPGGYEYGGWGRGYRVGPGRGGDRRGEHPSSSYRGAPASRATPSIPHGSRGGGGGARSGGGGHH
jgi:hypothetical protein